MHSEIPNEKKKKKVEKDQSKKSKVQGAKSPLWKLANVNPFWLDFNVKFIVFPVNYRPSRYPQET